MSQMNKVNVSSWADLFYPLISRLKLGRLIYQQICSFLEVCEFAGTGNCKFSSPFTHHFTTTRGAHLTPDLATYLLQLCDSAICINTIVIAFFILSREIFQLVSWTQLEDLFESTHCKCLDRKRPRWELVPLREYYRFGIEMRSGRAMMKLKEFNEMHTEYRLTEQQVISFSAFLH